MNRIRTLVLLVLSVSTLLGLAASALGGGTCCQAGPAGLARHGGVPCVCDDGIFAAVRRGDRDAVRDLLERKPELVNAKDPASKFLEAPLHLAVARGDYEMVELLLARGARIDIGDSDDSTPLDVAGLRSRTDILKLLVRMGAAVNHRDRNGMSPLLFAASSGHLAGVKFLLANGAEVDGVDGKGHSPLVYSLHRGRLDLLRLLLKAGADPNACGAEGGTPLFDAVILGQLSAVELLIEHGANAQAKTPFGATPLHAAVHRGNVEAAALLLEKGAPVDVRDAQGATPLLLAATRGQAELAALFLERGASAQRRGAHWGRTPLHWAAIQGNAKLAKVLLAHGAQVDTPDGEDHTARALAVRYGHADVAAALAAAGAATVAVEFEDPLPLLEKELADTEAHLWHLGNCGWAVKTRRHLLIFDYWNTGTDPARPSLANGHIDPAELADLDVAVFVTHEHGDHFDPAILEWDRSLEKLTYIFGFHPEKHSPYRERGYDGPAYEYVGPREQRELSGMRITTIRANDAGVGFLVEVDGLRLFHAGDHAGWRDGEREGFFAEVDWLAPKAASLDLAFLNVTGCHAHDPARLKEGNLHLLRALAPRTVVPTHAHNREYEYRVFEAFVRENEISTEVLCPCNRGDRFAYRRAAGSR